MDNQWVLSRLTNVSIGSIYLPLCHISEEAGDQRFDDGLWIIIVIGFIDFYAYLFQVSFELTFNLDSFLHAFLVYMHLFAQTFLFVVRFLRVVEVEYVK